MKSKEYTEEFKKEAIKQVTERCYSVADVAEGLGTTTHSVYAWMKKYGKPSPRQSDKVDVEAENLKLKAELRRMIEERDILKKAAVDSTDQRNTYVKTWVSRGSFYETYIYIIGKRVCF